jgi:hypothetical protein
VRTFNLARAARPPSSHTKLPSDSSPRLLLSSSHATQARTPATTATAVARVGGTRVAAARTWARPAAVAVATVRPRLAPLLGVPIAAPVVARRPPAARLLTAAATASAAMPPPPPPAATLSAGRLAVGGRPVLTGVPPSVTAAPGPLPGSLVLGLDLGGPTSQADVVLGKLDVKRWVEVGWGGAARAGRRAGTKKETETAIRAIGAPLLADLLHP